MKTICILSHVYTLLTMQCRCSYSTSAIWADTDTHLIAKTTTQSVRTMLFMIYCPCFLGWQPLPASEQSCGETYLTGDGGQIMSPGHPSPYPPDVQCTWMIRVKEDSMILMHFEVLDMGQSGQFVCIRRNINPSTAELFFFVGTMETKGIHLNTYVIVWRQLYMVNSFNAGIDYRCQILTCNVGPCAERVKFENERLQYCEI